MIRVLIVDDHPLMREILVGILHADLEMCVVGVASNGREALDFLAENEVDAITMDLRMPVMNGVEATRRIMASVPHPIVIVYGSWQPLDNTNLQEAIKAGAAGALEKTMGMGPVEGEDFAARLVSLVKAVATAETAGTIPAEDSQQRGGDT